MKLLYFYVPETHLDEVKMALFNIGVGKFKNYDCCSFQYQGVGQFRPLANSKPFLGEQDKIERVIEYKVEMIVTDDLMLKAKQTLLNSHPYEEVAYGFIDISQ